MKLTKENTKRKIDTLGRVSIPKGMRDRLNLKELSEVDFFLLEDDNGIQYACLTSVIPEEEVDKARYADAATVLHELGCAIPDELREALS